MTYLYGVKLYFALYSAAVTKSALAVRVFTTYIFKAQITMLATLVCVLVSYNFFQPQLTLFLWFYLFMLIVIINSRDFKRFGLVQHRPHYA
jgi:hypothetical protein